MLYNIKKSFAIHQIKQDNYSLYFEEYGNPNGIPVLFLHGGPGSGCNDTQKEIFNFKKYRVIFLDQRGAGKSSPKGCTINNTTQLLIKDIEFIRNYLKISSWVVVGGSWGATLAVAYAELHSNNVDAIILRSLFLGTEEEIEWAFFKAPLIFRPQLISDLIIILRLKKVINPIYALGKMLENKDNQIKNIGANLWSYYESNLSSINFNYEDIKKFSQFKNRLGKELPNTPFLEWHYIKNNFFFKKNQLMKNKYKLINIPIDILQSDYDLLCPPSTSFSFGKGLSNCKIHRVGKAGHYISDPGIKEKMRKILDEY